MTLSSLIDDCNNDYVLFGESLPFIDLLKAPHSIIRHRGFGPFHRQAVIHHCAVRHDAQSLHAKLGPICVEITTDFGAKIHAQIQVSHHAKSQIPSQKCLYLHFQ